MIHGAIPGLAKAGFPLAGTGRQKEGEMKTMYWKILGAVALSGMLFALPAGAEEAGDMPQTQPAQCGSDLSYRDDDPLAGILSAQRGCCSWHGAYPGSTIKDASCAMTGR